MPLYSMGCSPLPVFFFSSYAKSAIQALLQHRPSDNMHLLRGIWDVASKLSIPPLISWIPSYIGIEGNEAADRAARQALMKPDIDKYLPMSKARTRRNIKQTARDIYIRQLNNLTLRGLFLSINKLCYLSRTVPHCSTCLKYQSDYLQGPIFR